MEVLVGDEGTDVVWVEAGEFAEFVNGYELMIFFIKSTTHCIHQFAAVAFTTSRNSLDILRVDAYSG